MRAGQRGADPSKGKYATGVPGARMYAGAGKPLLQNVAVDEPFWRRMEYEPAGKPARWSSEQLLAL